MEHLQNSVQISTARGCGFGLLAIFCTMVGLSGTPALALKTGGLLCLVACSILIVKAQLSLTRSYKHTEVWLMLTNDQRPPATVAQRVIGGALQDAYRRFAFYFAVAAAAMLTLAFLVAST
jgi:hypothetical protein